MTDEALSDETKILLRKKIVFKSSDLLEIPYKKAITEAEKSAMVGKWIYVSSLPKFLDCSGLTQGLYTFAGLKMPHGSQNQYNFTFLSENPQIGDLSFLGENANPTKIYHVGMLYDNDKIIEARAFDKNASFETGKVIIRSRKNWENYKNFCGFRSHPKLIFNG